MEFKPINIDPCVCTGKPCIRGLRFPVSRLLEFLASRETQETFLKVYPYEDLEDEELEDMDKLLLYAAFLA